MVVVVVVAGLLRQAGLRLRWRGRLVWCVVRWDTVSDERQLLIDRRSGWRTAGQGRRDAVERRSLLLRQPAVAGYEAPRRRLAGTGCSQVKRGASGTDAMTRMLAEVASAALTLLATHDG